MHLYDVEDKEIDYVPVKGGFGEWVHVESAVDIFILIGRIHFMTLLIEKSSDVFFVWLGR